MNNTEKQKRTRPRSFSVALLISLAMIGAACAYAYQATTATLEDNLDSLQNELTAETEASTEAVTSQTTQPVLEAAAAGRRTELPVATEAPTETTTEQTEEAPAAEHTEQSLSHVIVKPVEGDVLQPFSNGELVKSETTGTWQTHNGTDLMAEEGTPVCAADNGTVTLVTKDPLWGICVEIDHGNGIISRYCSLSPSLSVQEGSAVESGQTIGSVGNTADAECKQESHLHFEVLKNGVYIDPVSFLSE